MKGLPMGRMMAAVRRLKRSCIAATAKPLQFNVQQTLCSSMFNKPSIVQCSAKPLQFSFQQKLCSSVYRKPSVFQYSASPLQFSVQQTICNSIFSNPFKGAQAWDIRSLGFSWFYTIKPLRVGDFGVKIKKNLKYLGVHSGVKSSLRVCSVYF
jgi:hypothetical protein